MNGKMMHNPITLLRQGRLETLIPAGKALIFAVLIVVEVVVFASNFDTMISYGIWITLAAEIALAVENASALTEDSGEEPLARAAIAIRAALARLVAQ